MEVIKSSSRVFILKLCSSLIVFAGIVLFSRLAGASTVGRYFLFEALISLTVILTDLGVKESAEKRLSEDNRPKNILGTALTIKTLSLSISLVAIFLLKDIILSYIDLNNIAFILLGVISMDLFQFGLKVLRGERKVVLANKVNLFKHIFWIVASYYFVLQGYNYPLITGLVCGLIISSSISFIFSSTGLGKPTMEDVMDIYLYAKDAFVAYIGGFSYQWIDIIILGFFVPSSAIAAYEAAWRITEGLLLLPRSVASSAFPEISYFNERDKERISEYIPLMIFISISSTLPAFLGSISNSEFILRLVFGEEFTVASIVLIIFTLQAVVQSYHHILTRVLQGIKQQTVVARSSVISVILNIVLNYIMIPKYGINGAAIATSVSYTIGTIYLHFSFSNIFSNPVNDPSVIRVLAASLGMFVYSYIFIKFIGDVTLITLILQIASSAIVYIILLLYSDVTKEYVYQVKSEI